MHRFQCYFVLDFFARVVLRAAVGERRVRLDPARPARRAVLAVLDAAAFALRAVVSVARRATVPVRVMDLRAVVAVAFAPALALRPVRRMPSLVERAVRVAVEADRRPAIFARLVVRCPSRTASIAAPVTEDTPERTLVAVRRARREPAGDTAGVLRPEMCATRSPGALMLP
ncbi:MAG: hypothetical protein JOZ99_02030 [Actinobacteria bacterium]|nr:hypothetical protein [Actinomycetota bacterium]